MFSFPLTSRNNRKVLIKKYSAEITKNTAEKYFGKKNATGKIIRLGRNGFYY
jgi:hypothetical protein